MGRRSPRRTGMYVVQTGHSGDLGALRDAGRDGRAAAMSRRRALAAGRSALGPAHERVRTGLREAELRAPAASNGQGAPNGGQWTAVVTDRVADAHLGRALSMQRRRQLSQGKQALNGGGDATVGAASAGAPALIVHRGGAR